MMAALTVYPRRYLEVMTVMKCFCCDKKNASSELLVVHAQTYCHVCAVGLFGETALSSPVPEHSATLGRLVSHLKVFFFLASGLWLLVLLYELSESAYKFVKAKLAKQKA